MSKIKYKYNTHTLDYERVEVTWKTRFFRVAGYLATSLVFGVILFFLSYQYLDSPKEIRLKEENNKLLSQYNLLNKRLSNLDNVLSNVEERDDDIYRAIFDAKPIPEDVRKAGFGGVNRYKDLEGYDNSSLMISTSKKLDILTKQLYIQSKSFDQIYKLAKNKKEMLAHIPAIQPISNKNLKRISSGFGWRIDPIYKTSEFHAGIDFAARRGTPIYATGDGTVSRADDNARGFGKHVVIDNGYGYQTLFGHMSKMAVKPGEKVHRGEVIGYVGSTGRSTGSHVHYEVIKDGKPINPINFFFNDLTPKQYSELVKLANRPNQSMD